MVYIWYRYPVTSWEDTHGTHNTFSYDPYNTGDTYHVGYLSIDDGEKVYSSYGFNSSTGLYYGSGSSKTYYISNIEENPIFYNNYYYFDSYYHCLYKIGGYYVFDGASGGDGHNIEEYRFANPIAYTTSSCEIITSTKSSVHDTYYDNTSSRKYDGYYNTNTDGYDGESCHEECDSDISDEMKWYSGYYTKYIGKY